MTDTGPNGQHTHPVDLSGYATKADLDALKDQFDHADAYVVDLEARLGTVLKNHSDRIAALEKPALVSVPPPPTGRVYTLPTNGTAAAFVTLAKDLTVGVIEFAAGTYAKWSCFLDVARPADKPLLVRPAAGAAVVWDGTGTTNAPPWRIGWSTLASYITFDATGGSFTAQNYRLGKAGVVMAKYVDHVAFHGLRVTGCFGDKAIDATLGKQHTHALYLGSNGTATPRSKAWESNNWVVEGPADRMLNGLQTDGTPNCDGVVAKGWKVSSCHLAAYPYNGSTGIAFDDWTITDCDATIENTPNTAVGVVSNSRAVRSGPFAPGQGGWKVGPLTGSGNTVG